MSVGGARESSDSRLQIRPRGHGVLRRVRPRARAGEPAAVRRMQPGLPLERFDRAPVRAVPGGGGVLAGDRERRPHPRPGGVLASEHSDFIARS